MNKHSVKFVRGSKTIWDQLNTTPEKIDNNTLYFIYEDENYSVGKLYLGQRLITDDKIINIKDIGDIQIDNESLIDKQILIYNEESQKWKNSSLEEIIDLNNYYTKNEIDNEINKISTKMDFIPINLTTEEIATLPAGQLYGDTVNHKGVIKGGQEFYDITATNNLIFKKLVPDVTINNPPVRYAATDDLYTIGTVLHVNISWSSFGYGEYDVVLESITTVAEGEKYIYNWKRVGCAPVCFTANGTGSPSSYHREYEGYDTPVKQGDFVIKRYQSEPAIIYVCDMVQDSQSGTNWVHRYQSYVWTRLAAHGTKLADYDIDNAYTKTEIDAMIGDIGTALDTLNSNLTEV